MTGTKRGRQSTREESLKKSRNRQTDGKLKRREKGGN